MQRTNLEIFEFKLCEIKFVTVTMISHSAIETTEDYVRLRIVYVWAERECLLGRQVTHIGRMKAKHRKFTLLYTIK